jgi:3-hydroxybutyryl-CoA dehydrogenase
MSVSNTGVIGVIGAGTMGAGIAQVALQSGYSVVLYDVEPAVLERAHAQIQQNLHRLLAKGKLSAEVADACLANLRLSSELGDVAEAGVVIEAVPERMDLKKSVFTRLEEVCGPTAILATNTSSLSVTVLAAACRHPERVVGMHFFNPAPVMRLVEVVVGEDTSSETVADVVDLARRFGKEPIVCKDTPGFIVNRVARNFYGEALRIVGEGTASPALVDQLMEQAAGFRMGPFALMDLIGIDVNFDVTRSVYHAYHGEPRYRPHALQERMVAAGRLGRKTGRGFYRYTEAGEAADRSVEPASDWPRTVDLGQVAVVGDTAVAEAMLRRLAQVSGRPEGECGLVYTRALPEWDHMAIRWRAEEIESWLRQRRPAVVWVSLTGDEAYQRSLLQAVERGIREDALLVTSLAGPSATEQASWLVHGARVRGFSVLPEDGTSGPEARAMEWSVPLQAMAADPALVERDNRDLQSVAAALGWNPVQIRDGAGGVALRILAMICNEAAEIVREGSAPACDVDTGMRLGTNYPHGPLEWMDMLGIPLILSTLSGLSKEFGEDRYRPSPQLRHMAAAGWDGKRTGRGWYEYPEVLVVK